MKDIFNKVGNPIDWLHGLLDPSSKPLISPKSSRTTSQMLSEKDSIGMLVDQYGNVIGKDPARNEQYSSPPKQNLPGQVKGSQTQQQYQPQPGQKNVPPNPYEDLVAKYFPSDQSRMSRTAFGESSYDARRIHSNNNIFTPQDGVQLIPGDPQAATIPPDFTRQQWAQLRQNHPDLDIGLLQIHTDPAGAMADYLQNNGLTFYDLLDPEKNLKVASDLYYGRIPKTAPGIGNWVAARNLGFK